MVWTVASAAVAVMALSGTVWHFAFGASQSRQDARIDRLADIVELQAVITVGDSTERVVAMRELKGLRRIVR